MLCWQQRVVREVVTGDGAIRNVVRKTDIGIGPIVDWRVIRLPRRDKLRHEIAATIAHPSASSCWAASDLWANASASGERCRRLRGRVTKYARYRADDIFVGRDDAFDGKAGRGSLIQLSIRMTVDDSALHRQWLEVIVNLQNRHGA